MNKQKDPIDILRKASEKTSNIGASVVLSMAVIYLHFGEEKYRSIYRPTGGSSVAWYFSTPETGIDNRQKYFLSLKKSLDNQ
jgi:hypothetical protein